MTLVAGDLEYTGWALNISRGGIRVVIEGHLELGEQYEIRDLDSSELDVVGAIIARVVWVQDEPDGSVVGLEFVSGVRGTDKPPGP